MKHQIIVALVAVPFEVALVLLGLLNLRNALRRFQAGDTVRGTGLAIVAATGAIALALLNAACRGVKL